jgi:DNA polymerase V
MEIFLGEGADEFLERGKDLNEELIKNKTTTFFYRMKGDSMAGAGIHDRDLLIVDRSLKANSGKVIIAVFNGEVMVRRFQKNLNSAFLIPENNKYKQSDLAEFSDFVILGVVTYVIHQVQ